MNCVQICVHSRSNRPPKVKSLLYAQFVVWHAILGRRFFFFKFILLFSSASRLTNNTGVSTSCEWWVERGGVGTTLFMCSPKEEDKEVHPERTKKGHYEWNARLVWNERRKKGIVVSVLFRNAPHYIRSSRPSMRWTEQRWWPPARDAIVNDPRPLHPMWSFY